MMKKVLSQFCRFESEERFQFYSDLSRHILFLNDVERDADFWALHDAMNTDAKKYNAEYVSPLQGVLDERLLSYVGCFCKFNSEEECKKTVQFVESFFYDYLEYDLGDPWIFA